MHADLREGAIAMNQSTDVVFGAEGRERFTGRFMPAFVNLDFNLLGV